MTRRKLLQQDTPRCLLQCLVLCLGIGGCSLAPDYAPPPVNLPLTWNIAPGMPATNNRSPAQILPWQEFVTNSHLRTLIQMALDNNRNLRQTLLNVEVARALYRIQRAERLPSVGIKASGTRQRLPGNLALDNTAHASGTYQVGLELPAFELDLFGRVYNLSQAALEEYLATEEGARNASLSLVTEVIQAFISRQDAFNRYDVLRKVLASREESLDLIRKRYDSGTTSILHYQQAQILVSQAQAGLEVVDRELRQSTNALVLLVGSTDVSVLTNDEIKKEPVIVQHIQPGIPSDLLLWRPDIRAAEHQLKVSNANIGAARAAFLPSISLTGLFGNASAELSGLFSGQQRTWTFVPQLNLPLFNAGNNVANLELATVREAIAVSNYEMTIQTAFREVSDVLAALDTLDREEAALKTASANSIRSLEVARVRYIGGLDDYLVYLDALRSDLGNQIALTEISTQRQSALVSLFKTLGGAW